MPALDSLRTALQGALDESIRTHGVPGAVLGVLQGGERLVLAAGCANVATGVDVTPDTLFQVGAISKAYTATLVMQLLGLRAIGVGTLGEPNCRKITQLYERCGSFARERD